MGSSHGQREMGHYMQGGAENKAADEGLSQADTGEQSTLAEAKFSCKGDTVRIFSPIEQVHFLDYGQKETLPLDCLLDPSHPVISFLLGIGMNFVHFRTSR